MTERTAIAVVTPVRQDFEREALFQCFDSVSAQTMPVHHVVVFDGEVRSYPMAKKGADRTYVVVPKCGDYGNTPRAMGTTFAWMKLYAEYVLWLDADNWWLPEHVEHLVQLQKNSGAGVVASQRWIVRPDGTDPRIAVQEDLTWHRDTSCLCFYHTRALTSLSPVLLMQEEHRYADKQISYNVQNDIKTSAMRTCFYRSNYVYHKRLFNWPDMGILWRDEHGNLVSEAEISRVV